ncbi:PAS domain-containing protein [Chelatococcus sp. SYSU_G07232]|uniref:PAS domain-containing protein n=1 Tax=Chelatococcus albus TaxID=3047466 RepID=A0ABT7AJ43_9HYPH|nr:PAS domain-containing protein [Chelatococcus sp. SYSU_G07232]MDJ1159391.1 PAS domain-containing protein [Chelatococcus sp. SYSU_G07232]
MKHATTRILFSYWDKLRGERMAPERGEIEPGAIRHVLADTFILEVAAHGTVTFRLAGTRLCALFGSELKYRRLASLWGGADQLEIARLVNVVLDESAGVVGGVTGTTVGGETIELELLLLPLRHHGKSHARVLGALSPQVVPTWLGFDRIGMLSTTSQRIIWPAGREPDGAPLGADVDTRPHRLNLVILPGGRH